jgi:hypothetical protein
MTVNIPLFPPRITRYREDFFHCAASSTIRNASVRDRFRIPVRILLALLLLIAAGLARGQVLDSVEVQRRGDKAEISIRFAAQVQYLRHVPLDSGSLLRIYLRLVGPGIQESDVTPESRRFPRNGLVPQFTVRFPEPDGALLITFDQPVQFVVRPGADGRSITITVPVIPGAKDEQVERKGALPAAALPPSRPLTFIDGVEVIRRGKQAEIRIRFTTAVQYLRHVPQDAAQSLQVELQFAGSATREDRLTREILRLARTDLVPLFTLTYPETGNAVHIAFDQPTPIAVRQGTDARSISIFVPALPGAKDLTVEGSGPRIVAVAAALAPAPASPAAAIAPVPAAIAAPAPAAIAAPATAAVGALVAALPSELPQAAPVVAPLTSAEIETRAKALMDAARQSIAVRKGVDAADKLGQVLNLPLNRQYQAAQALMGEAREFSGELRRARIEYELYLKLYPKGEEAPRVRERLAALDKTLAQLTAGATGASGTGVAQWTVNGSVSQYRYEGKSRIETITPPPPGQLLFNQDTLSLTDQNALLSTFDLAARQRDGARDTRIVIRDSNTENYLPNQLSYNRLNAAYFEESDNQVGYLVRAGRQLGSGGGVFGRFDGLLAGYEIKPGMRLNGVAGIPVEFNSSFRRSFYGASMDFLPQLGKPGFGVYYIEQTLEGLLDRRAVGGEGRYFDQFGTVFSMLDYDLLYKLLNIAMVQGNWRTVAGVNYFATYDYRKSPPLGMTNALPGETTQSIQQLAQDLGLVELRKRAATLTSSSTFYSLGIMSPVTPTWQLGGNFNRASISGTGESGILPAQPGSGTSYVYSGQAIGNNIGFTNAALVLNVSLIRAPTYDGKSYVVTYAVPIGNWRFDTILRYYTQLDNQEQKQTRLSPTFKTSYRWINRVSLELEIGDERFDEAGPLRELHSSRRYVFGGYRWDFQ